MHALHRLAKRFVLLALLLGLLYHFAEMAAGRLLLAGCDKINYLTVPFCLAFFR